MSQKLSFDSLLDYLLNSPLSPEERGDMLLLAFEQHLRKTSEPVKILELCRKGIEASRTIFKQELLPKGDKI